MVEGRTEEGEGREPDESTLSLVDLLRSLSFLIINICHLFGKKKFNPGILNIDSIIKQYAFKFVLFYYRILKMLPQYFPAH